MSKKMKKSPYNPSSCKIYFFVQKPYSKQKSYAIIIKSKKSLEKGID